MNLEDARLLALHHISIHAPDYSFKFDESATALGRCWYRKRLITLSRYWVEALDKHEVLDTILHECAHALAGKDGHYGHGIVWKQYCVFIGAKPERTCNTHILRRDVKKPLYEMRYGTEVVKSYYARPSERTYDHLSSMYLNGRKEETQGKLVIVSTKESQLQKLYEAGITFTGMSKKCLHCNKKNTAWTITQSFTWLHSCGQETPE